VEFTFAAIPAAVLEPFRPAQLKPLVPSPVARLDRPIRLKIADKPKTPPGRAKEMVAEPQSNVADAAPPIETKPDADPERNELLGAVEEVAAVAAKAAKDYRAWFLENMKSNMAAGLAFAGGLANLPAHTNSDGAQKAADAAESKHDLSASTRVATDFYNKAVALMTANLDAAVEYAQRLGDVTSASEFIALSSSHARKHAELVITQTAALGAFSQEFSEASTEQVTADLDKAFERKP
jgi:hypothetical protein